jgi:hypothetical protein
MLGRLCCIILQLDEFHLKQVISVKIFSFTPWRRVLLDKLIVERLQHEEFPVPCVTQSSSIRACVLCSHKWSSEKTLSPVTMKISNVVFSAMLHEPCIRLYLDSDKWSTRTLTFFINPCKPSGCECGDEHSGSCASELVKPSGNYTAQVS